MDHLQTLGIYVATGYTVLACGWAIVEACRVLRRTTDSSQ
jgi:hypothetical protein